MTSPHKEHKAAKTSQIAQKSPISNRYTKPNRKSRNSHKTKENLIL
jgi:hypothetical protein